MADADMKSTSSGGFTEDDQARIAEEVLGRVGSKRTGLGFSGGGDQAVKATASSASSGWFQHHEESASRDEDVATEPRDTTEGPFAWDGGQRDKARGAAHNKDSRRSSGVAHRREAESDRPAERGFPMVRDRDIERLQGVRHRQKRTRSRSHSRSRSRSRDRGRERGGRRTHRSRSRSRERREAERGRERQRERERMRQREGERARQRQREADKERYRRNRRSRSPDTSSRCRHADREKTHPKQAGKVPVSLPTAEHAKAAVKRQLRKAAVQDATLKTGAKSTVGGAAGWERPEMSMTSDFFTRDEIASKGGVASVAPEYEARLAEILAVEDEDVMCLHRRVQPAATGGGLDPSTQKHHDAIFAPTGSTVSEAVDSTPATVLSTARIRSAGVSGGAARARAVLTGKLREESNASPKSAPTAKPKKIVQDKQLRDDDSDQPLFKTLRAGETVEAQWTADDKWYNARVVQSIHTGFEIARYKVRYTEYGNEETISWTRIRRLTGADALSPLPKSAEMETTPEEETQEPANDVPPPFAGMRPRALCVEQKVPPETNLGDEPAKVADVVNPVLRSGTSGRKLSWKEKLAARTTPRVDLDQKQKEISLVPDFAAQRMEQEVERAGMDKSEWRTKVAFGIGSSKKSRERHT